MYPYRITQATWNIWSLLFSYTSQKFLSILQHKQQVFGHNAWWNRGSGDFRRPVQHMQKGQWTVLQFKYTSSTNCKFTNMYSSFIYQGQEWHQEKMLTTNQEGWLCKYPNTYCSKYLDTDLSTHSSVNRNNAHMPQRSTQIHQNADTHWCFSITTSL